MGLESLPESIFVEVDYYDEPNKLILAGSAAGKSIEQLVHDGVQIPTPEFLTYYLFHRKRASLPGYRNYDEISNHIAHAVRDLDSFIKTNGRSLWWPVEVEKQQPSISERIGESVGLSVASRIHGLTEADWTKIKEKGGPKGVASFDYELGSNGKELIQLEAKGASLRGEVSRAGIRGQAESVARKKEKIRERENQDDYPYRADVRYGAVTAIGQTPQGNLKCWLMDPPPEARGVPPVKQKLVSRFAFFSQWISLISPRSPLSIALWNRLSAIDRTTEYTELDSIPLLDGYQREIEFSSIGPWMNELPSFFQSRSRVTDGPAGGIVVSSYASRFFFVGLMGEVIDLMASQRFDAILNYRKTVARVAKQVDCVISRREFDRIPQGESIYRRARIGQSQVRIRLEGLLHYSDVGLVFGELA